MTKRSTLGFVAFVAALVAGAVGALFIGYLLNLLLSGVVRDTATRLPASTA